MLLAGEEGYRDPKGGWGARPTPVYPGLTSDFCKVGLSESPKVSQRLPAVGGNREPESGAPGSKSQGPGPGG